MTHFTYVWKKLNVNLRPLKEIQKFSQLRTLNSSKNHSSYKEVEWRRAHRDTN